MTITIALSKGRIFDETLPLLAAAGIEVTEDPEKSRKLILPTTQPDVRVLLVRPSDVPTYVQWGGADLGVTGARTSADIHGAGRHARLGESGGGGDFVDQVWCRHERKLIGLGANGKSDGGRALQGEREGIN